MKRAVLSLILFFLLQHVDGQLLPDSVSARYKSAKTSGEKGKLLLDALGSAGLAPEGDTRFALDLLASFRKEQDQVGVDYTQLYISNTFLFKGDYTAALSMLSPLHERFGQRRDQYGLMRTNHAMALALSFAKNFEPAFVYSRKAIEIAETNTYKDYLGLLYNDFAVMFYMANIPDSGLLYAQMAIRIDTENKDMWSLATSISSLAENYLAAGEPEIAIPFLRKAMSFIDSANALPGYARAFLYNDFAQAFLLNGRYDSLMYFVHQALFVGKSKGYPDQVLRSYQYLYEAFEKMSNQDSANLYFRMAASLKDSLYSMEKTRSLENWKFREILRQEEQEAVQAAQAKNRKQNTQYALIGFGIVCFLIGFLLLSRRHITNPRFIRFMGILALLLVFEFLNLLLHPFLERITHHSPVLMLLALVCIAALLVPLHHRLEKWAINRLIEKNKKIRLAAAKRTISQLENEISEENKNL